VVGGRAVRGPRATTSKFTSVVNKADTMMHVDSSANPAPVPVPAPIPAPVLASNVAAVERATSAVEWARVKAERAAARLAAAEARLVDIRENPRMYTTGALIRRRRPWSKCRKWRCWDLEDGVRTTSKEYSSMREMAVDRELSYEVLRHVVANDKAGREIKSERYRCFEMEKILKEPKAPKGPKKAGAASK
jgi:hypothetical protein